MKKLLTVAVFVAGWIWGWWITRPDMKKIHSDFEVGMISSQARARRMVESMKTPDWFRYRDQIIEAEEMFNDNAVVQLSGHNKQEIDQLIFNAWRQYASECVVWSQDYIDKRGGDEYRFRNLDDCIQALRKTGDSPTALKLEAGVANLRKVYYINDVKYHLGSLAKSVQEAKQHGGQLSPEQLEEVRRLIDSLR